MKEEEENKVMTHSLNELTIDFGGMTTMHGMTRAICRKQRHRRIVWSILVLISSTWAAYQLSTIIKIFYTHPVSTTVSIKFASRLVFPAVTICNLNKVRMSKLPESLRQEFRQMQKEGIWLNDEDIADQISVFSPKDIMGMGHAMSDMLIGCWFDQKPCTADNFTHMEYSNGKYGNCFTFADTRNHSKEWTTTKPGPQNGLTLELDIQQRDYIPFTVTAGIKVVLHPGDVVPFPEDGGLIVGPGVNTNIGIRKVLTIRQPPPYETCISADQDKNRELNMFAYAGYNYSDSACTKTCYQKKVYETCRCCDNTFPCENTGLFRSTDNTIVNHFGVIPLCYQTNATASDCVENIMALYLSDELKCSDNCPPACNQTDFPSVVSTGDWPAGPYTNIFLSKVNESGHSKNVTYDYHGNTGDYVGNNFLRMEIYYESLNYDKILTEPTYDWNKLLSDIGGQMGLWLGFSALTAIELLELLLDVVVCLCVRMCRRQAAVKSRDNELDPPRSFQKQGFRSEPTVARETHANL